ncbi:MAG: hydrogenase maturation peptidase HycI [Omnitrophica bacterium RIFOXYB12_FULL_50_7]|nr:MAG: hydrogenase maturation peptidase HycI [Omnitrophica bacterium RIFOXYB12_FULL_50_7]
MSNLLTGDVLAVLNSGSGAPLFLTVGNLFRSDDGVGPYLASRLVVLPVRIVNAGHTPENIIDEVVGHKPSRIIILDAADFGGRPGEVRVIPEEAIPETTLTTHRVPMNVISRLIKDDTGAKVVFLGIQPKTVSLGEGLTPEVQAAADEIIETIKSSLRGLPR